MVATFPIVDLFAGCGGLGEGFSAFRERDGHRTFRIALSVEKEASAFETLRLRSFLRQFTDGFPKEYYDFINRNLEEPDWSKLYPQKWRAACAEVLKLELGTPGAKKILEPRLDALDRAAPRNVIVVGGPPCQAYSVVGRARNRGVEGYEARDDHRHFLYREYINVLRKLKPAVFVMENVKGMISSSVDGEYIFDLVLADLRRAGGTRDSYRLFALAPRRPGGKLEVAPATDHQSFVVCAEHFGIPQARHRVILLGVRSDLIVSDAHFSMTGLRQSGSAARHATVHDVLQGLPKLRSGVSTKDSGGNWSDAVAKGLSQIARLGRSDQRIKDVSARALQLQKPFRRIKSNLHRSSFGRPGIGLGCSRRLKKWILDPKLRIVPNNLTRSHMRSDLVRYLFASIFAQVRKRSPKSSEFPRVLSPAHRNWRTEKFKDRFRVQLPHLPSSTITSHISKDGHYFIHPDPLQCRSLTVREAARLQTFPDNYFFKGNKTQQYVQVGNAVPPYLALQIATIVNQLLKTKAVSKGAAKRRPEDNKRDPNSRSQRTRGDAAQNGIGSEILQQANPVLT